MANRKPQKKSSVITEENAFAMRGETKKQRRRKERIMHLQRRGDMSRKRRGHCGIVDAPAPPSGKGENWEGKGGGGGGKFTWPQDPDTLFIYSKN